MAFTDQIRWIGGGYKLLNQLPWAMPEFALTHKADTAARCKMLNVGIDPLTADLAVEHFTIALR